MQIQRVEAVTEETQVTLCLLNLSTHTIGRSGGQGGPVASAVTERPIERRSCFSVFSIASLRGGRSRERGRGEGVEAQVQWAGAACEQLQLLLGILNLVTKG